MYRYAQSAVGPEHALYQRSSLLKLKKYWDGVTGTIFNIPTKKLEDQTLDKATQHFNRESLESHDNYVKSDIFPLDIRRIEKVSTALGSDQPAVDVGRDTD